MKLAWNENNGNNNNQHNGEIIKIWIMAKNNGEMAAAASKANNENENNGIKGNVIWNNGISYVMVMKIMKMKYRKWKA
jgi:hypothetical protein